MGGKEGKRVMWVSVKGESRGGGRQCVRERGVGCVWGLRRWGSCVCGGKNLVEEDRELFFIFIALSIYASLYFYFHLFIYIIFYLFLFYIFIF